MTRRILVWLAMALIAAPAWGASLRGMVSLQDASVRLSDLFNPVDEDRIIGPAPEPGSRIVVEAAQLAAIARQFNVDWRPASTTDHTVIERPGVALPRAAVMAALQAALSVAGAPPDADILLPGYVPPMVPPDGSAAPEADQVDYDSVSGRFTAMLSIVANGMNPIHTRLSGRVQPMIEAPVATRRLLPGDVVGPGDVQVARIRANGIRAEVAQSPTQAVGMSLRRAVAIGAPMPLADLMHPILVRKGGSVAMLLDSPGLSLSAQGLAAEDGAMGDIVRVMNPVSRAIVAGQVTGPDLVRVTGGPPTGMLPPGAAALASR